MAITVKQICDMEQAYLESPLDELESKEMKKLEELIDHELTKNYLERNISVKKSLLRLPDSLNTNRQEKIYSALRKLYTEGGWSISFKELNYSTDFEWSFNR